jgi:hypothetical protein
MGRTGFGSRVSVVKFSSKSRIFKYAALVKLVDTLVLGTSGVTLPSSSLGGGTSLLGVGDASTVLV